MNPSTSSRPLTTSARVHPPYLPYLHNAASRNRGKGLKWIPPLAAVVTAGYAAAATYRQTRVDQGLATTTSEAERRRHDAAMADAYGDRGSLEELERAMRVYETQRGN
ncbi:N-acetylglucosaminyl-phosphatidylinositol [Chaetomidium leptoderma]|uniref:N-acetylglucosaminyl-phosphatidylinositol n=1 Tax=Chaetomidium leptoderma TaxID=669021 RepID=A0AAN6VI96_9PEZI|nr:N-acetylglucosaminyl-phosphatidylinositol [Chaetomidium leptoderma]